MGKEVKTASSVFFANGESIVKSCVYGSVSSKEYLRTGSICLTNKRLIHHLHDEAKGMVTDQQQEIPLEDVDGISYAFEQKRKPLSLAAIIAAVIVFVMGIVMFIVSGSSGNSAFIWVGIGLILVTALIVLLAILLRKKMASFSFSVDTYNTLYYQFGFGNVPVEVADTQETLKKRRRIYLLIGLGINVLIAAVVGILIATGVLKGQIPTIVGAAVGLFLISANSSIWLRRVRNTKPQKAALVDGVLIPGAVVIVNEDSCKSFLNDIGSAINDLKEKIK